MRILLCKSQLDGPISGADETLVTYAAQLQKAGQAVSVLLMYLHADRFKPRTELAGRGAKAGQQDVLQLSGFQAVYSSKDSTGVDGNG